MRNITLLIAAVSLVACQKDQDTRSATAQPTPQEEPATMAQTQPSTMAQEEPTTMAQEEPGTMAQTLPSTMAQTLPTTMESATGPTITQGPTTMAQTQPSTLAQQEPTTTAQEEPGTLAQTLPTTQEGQPTTTATTNFEPILFNFDEASLSNDAMEALNQLAAYLFDHPEVGVVISGHTDERGTDEYNMALGDQRARVAKDYLTRLGVDPSRIAIVSYGEASPVATGEGEDSWSKNRRSEFKIVSKDEVQASR